MVIFSKVFASQLPWKGWSFKNRLFIFCCCSTSLWLLKC